jgi:hypothetical protein
MVYLEDTDGDLLADLDDVFDLLNAGVGQL